MKTKLIAFTVLTHLPGMGGVANGYVALPKGHPCYGLDYNTIHEKYSIDVHGGLTYSDEGGKMLEFGAPKEITSDLWVVGFDTFHLGDKGKWQSIAEVQAEANRLKNQLENPIPQ